MTFHRSLKERWSPQSVQNRGLTDDPSEANNRKAAVQKKIMLERMLGLIAQFAPSLLRNENIKRSTSLSWIWQRIRKHFNFVQSEVNFLTLSNISRKQDERYETFYQRIVAHLEDNLFNCCFQSPPRWCTTYVRRSYVTHNRETRRLFMATTH